MTGIGRPRIARACSANSREVLRDQRHQARVVRPRRDFAEPNRRRPPRTARRRRCRGRRARRDCLRDALRLGERGRAHRLRLPRLAIVAVDLQMTDRIAERRAAAVTHGQQRDLVVELDEPFDDDAPAAGAAALLRVVPRLLDVGLRAHRRSVPCPTSSSPASRRTACPSSPTASRYSAIEPANRYGEVGSPSCSAASRRMPSRSIVSRAARAVGIDGEAVASPAPAASASRSPRSPAR